MGCMSDMTVAEVEPMACDTTNEPNNSSEKRVQGIELEGERNARVMDGAGWVKTLG